MTLNCAELFRAQAQHDSKKIALWLPEHGQVTFGQLMGIAARAQQNAWARGLVAGDSVLVMVPLSPELYGVVLGLISAGMSVVLVEPWLKVAKIDRIISDISPAAFVAGTAGRLWGARVSKIRAIGQWISPEQLLAGRLPPQLHLEEVSPNTPAIITFTSGTSGAPKGMVRSHQLLRDQHLILTAALDSSTLTVPDGAADLTIFANFVLFNLANGRTSLIVPPRWKQAHLEALNSLPKELRPVSVTCGPAFLRRLIAVRDLSTLCHFHIGGALTDCETFEDGFNKWPHAHWTHLYGSTEAEPVACTDARLAVQKSREAGYFQTLYLGQPVPQVKARLEEDSLWVTGAHVCPEYLASNEENRLNKRRDEFGQVWHRMGDRIRSESDGWWYVGRSQQDPDAFVLEQKLYSGLQSSSAFVSKKNQIFLVYSEDTAERRDRIQTILKENLSADDFRLAKVIETEIKRDPRHRARIDRQASSRTPWRAIKVVRKLLRVVPRLFGVRGGAR